MTSGLHGHIGMPHAHVCNGKGKIVFSHMMCTNLTKFDWHTHLCILIYMPMYGQCIWILDKDSFCGDFKICY